MTGVCGAGPAAGRGEDVGAGTGVERGVKVELLSLPPFWSWSWF